MRILFGIDTFGLVGGTERYAAVVVPALLERGHEVAVLCRELPAEPLLPPRAGLTVHLAQELGTPSFGRHERRALRARLGALAPDLIFLQTARDLSALEVLIESAPLVRFVHDHTLFCPGLNKVQEDGELCDQPLGLWCLQRYYLAQGCVCFKRAGHRNALLQPLSELAAKLREVHLNQQAAALLTNSRYMRGELLRAGFSPARTSVLPLFTQSNSALQPALPLSTLPAQTRAFLAASDAPLVFTPARLTLPDKGVDFLLSALAGVRAPLRALIAGDGPALGWLRQKARDEGLEGRVHFTGWIGQGHVEALLDACALVVVPSVWNEPFGLVGLEAMAHSKPVVAFAVGGIPEWLAHERTGLLATRKDAGQLGAHIERLLANPDEGRWYGLQGRQRLEREFTREAHLEALERALEGALAQHS